MNTPCEAMILPTALHSAAWLGGIIRSLFPWPAVVLFAFLFPPARRALDRIVTSLVDSMRTLRQIKAVGVEVTLDPEAAREIYAKSGAVVQGDYERRADEEVARLRVWVKFNRIIEQVVHPLAQSSFRATIHVEDVLDRETLYQLIEYVYVSELAGPPKTRGRRNSIRFGIIGRAWRLGRPEYDPSVTTDISDLVRLWGMTHDEAVRAGRGRKSFAVVLLRDGSGGYSGLIFIDAEAPNLFGQVQIDDLANRIDAAAATPDGLNESLARIRSTLEQELRAPVRR